MFQGQFDYIRFTLAGKDRYGFLLHVDWRGVATLATPSAETTFTLADATDVRVVATGTKRFLPVPANYVLEYTYQVKDFQDGLSHLANLNAQEGCIWVVYNYPSVITYFNVAQDFPLGALPDGCRLVPRATLEFLMKRAGVEVEKPHVAYTPLSEGGGK